MKSLVNSATGSESAATNVGDLLDRVHVDHNVIGVGHDQIRITWDVVNRDSHLVGSERFGSYAPRDGTLRVSGANARDRCVAGDAGGCHLDPPIGWKIVTPQAEWEFVPLDAELRERYGCDFGLRHRTLPYDPNRDCGVMPSTEYAIDGTPLS